ncbi:MAG TPA: alpha/beta hydrolase-fold protein [Chloroflexota bacterium]|nr:alpha/beta hydrolase-fold protein [Chloroflexota bacterium]
MWGLTASLDARAAKDTSSTLGTLRATLCAAALALPTALIPTGPLAAQSAQPPLVVPPVSALPPIGPGGPLFAPDSFEFDAARRAHLARSALYFIPGEHESWEEDGVYVLPAPVPWPPGAGARDVSLTVPSGKPLFLLAGLAPGNAGFNGPPVVTLDGASLGDVRPHAVRGIPVSDGTHQQEHAALALVLAPPAPGRHIIEVHCGVCAPARGPWLGLLNGGSRRYDLIVEEPPAPLSEALLISTHALMAPPLLGDLPAAEKPVAGTVLERRFHSPALGRELPYRVYLPGGYDQPSAPDTSPRRYPVLYLLHGLGGGIQQWSRLGLEAELDRQGTQAIVVAPAGRAGYWVNHADGGPRWADYVANDVVAHVDATYRTVPRREARAIGGISMGGHGALQLALNNPQVFGTAGAHSPALRTRETAPHFLGGLLMAASPAVVPQQAYAVRDPIILATLAQADAPPRLWIDTGETDPWRPRAEELRLALRARGWQHLWSVQPGAHDGPYWTRRLPEYIRYYREQLGA